MSNLFYAADPVKGFSREGGAVLPEGVRILTGSGKFCSESRDHNCMQGYRGLVSRNRICGTDVVFPVDRRPGKVTGVCLNHFSFFVRSLISRMTSDNMLAPKAEKPEGAGSRMTWEKPLSDAFRTARSMW